MENPHLNPALAGKYSIEGTHLPRMLNTPIGDVDFRELTEAQAEQLVSHQVYYLVMVDHQEAGEALAIEEKPSSAE